MMHCAPHHRLSGFPPPGGCRLPDRRRDHAARRAGPRCQCQPERPSPVSRRQPLEYSGGSRAGGPELRRPDREYRAHQGPASGFRCELPGRAVRHSLRRRGGEHTVRDRDFQLCGRERPRAVSHPPDAPIEGGSASSGDRHVLVIDRDDWKLYELFSAFPVPSSSGWTAGSGAILDLSSDALRPAGWTSADAAGLPIFPGLVRYDEVVERGEIRHALRFTVVHSRRAYVYPARHWASSDTSASRPPMGMRVRLKQSYDISGFPPSARVVLRALQTYGMIVADNGGDWFISGAPDARWNDGELNTLKTVPGSAFEVVAMGTIVTP